MADELAAARERERELFERLQQAQEATARAHSEEGKVLAEYLAAVQARRLAEERARSKEKSVVVRTGSRK